MGKIIDSNNLDKHHVKKFQFSTLVVDDDNKTSFNPALFTDKEELETTSNDDEEIVVTPEKEEANELLQKIEELSSKNIELESKLEQIQNEFDEKLSNEIEDAYQKGRIEATKDTQETMQEQNDSLNIQLVKSIASLDEQLQKHEEFLTQSKEELIEASSIIAKKIIKDELNENSELVAKRMADSFIEELKDASSITLKVHPKDATYLEEAYQTRENIKIEADDAINKGGIIILSDIGNIDGNIDIRIKKAIALIKQED